ncbi:hypothetical protein [Aureibacter tunicatorum]|uniref:Uncharacterized protein n=1 Tax=Aureibacter tunicatorum TaxID=866807 RepID=A0AAE4BQ07_9BACT|nr:hypothetical protein [Aureibacter tunicatorum]MDR6238569.1 hypothetical protein [Aureibacter tunicatorum]BDD05500.1 hypothetical protein AUTU_29830 [Aureibacter tunicatorum]
MITSIIPIVFGGLIFYVLFKFKGASKAPIDKNALTKKFKPFDIKIFVSFLVLLPLNTIIFTYLLTQLSSFGYTNKPETEFLIRPDAGTWFGIALSFSMGTSLALLILIIKKIKHEEEGQYWQYYNLKYGFNAALLVKYLTMVITIFATVFCVSQLNSFVRFNSNSISINKPFETSERSYSLKDISEITYYLKTVAPNGNIIDKPHYSIEFSDGFQWRTNDDFRTPNAKDVEIINWLINKTGLKLEEIEIDKN